MDEIRFRNVGVASQPDLVAQLLPGAVPASSQKPPEASAMPAAPEVGPEASPETVLAALQPVSEGGANSDSNGKPVADSVAKSATADKSAPAAGNNSGPYPWILNPTIDLLLCCGGLFWILYGVLACTGFNSQLIGGSPTAFWLATISIVGMHLIGDAHQPATLFRVYVSPVTRKSLGVKVAVVGVIALLAGLCTLCISSTATFFLKLVLAWGIQHQLAQSFGIALVYCFKRKYYMSRTERNIMFYMTQAAIVYLIARMFAVKDFGSMKVNGYQVPFIPLVPEWFMNVALVALQISVVVFAGMIVRKYIKEKRIFPLPALMTIMTLIMMPFLAGPAFVTVWYLFSTTFFHSSQYLVVTSSFYFKERGLPENVSFAQIGNMISTRVFAKYFAIVFGFGFVISYLLPSWMSEHGIEKSIAFASIYVMLNLHHFVTDMFIWKLRDPQIQKLLVA